MEDIQALDLLTAGVGALMLAFARVGTAVMVMPTLGDAFAPVQVRLTLALALTLVLLPLLAASLPAALPPAPVALAALLAAEIAVGLLFGTIARVLFAALDTAGMVISIHSGLSAAQVFNPALASQGSLIGAALTLSGIVMMFALNLHHLLILGIVESYTLFPVGAALELGDAADAVLRAVSASFALGVALAGPFIVVTLLVYAGMGVLTRLMPQMHVFIVVLPVQILISMAVLGVSVGAILTIWADAFADGIRGLFGGAI